MSCCNLRVSSCFHTRFWKLAVWTWDHAKAGRSSSWTVVVCTIKSLTIPGKHDTSTASSFWCKYVASERLTHINEYVSICKEHPHAHAYVHICTWLAFPCALCPACHQQGSRGRGSSAKPRTWPATSKPEQSAEMMWRSCEL